jgi:hypothetical protein
MNTKTKQHSRNIDVPEEWYLEIAEAVKQPDAPRTIAAWIREATREKLDRVQTAEEMRQIEERQAATSLKILAIIDRIERAVQTQIAFQDALCKVVLSNLPEPANVEAARELGQRRYAKVIEHAARQLATNGNGKAN